MHMHTITRNNQPIATSADDCADAVFTIFATCTRAGDTLRLVSPSGEILRTHQGERALSFRATARSRARVATQPSLL